MSDRNDGDHAAGAPKILIVGINYAPEEIGIGPYTSAMAMHLSALGHPVEVITALPYYPAWRGWAGYGLSRYLTRVEGGVSVTRCPIYVPRVPSGMRRVFHHISFAVAVIWPLLKVLRSRRRPGLVAVVAPSMMAAPVVRLFARLFGAKSWLHIQDFEVGAALATGLFGERSLAGRAARLFQDFAYRGFDLYSSISPQMCASLAAQGHPRSRIYEFRNWGDVDAIEPIDTRESVFRDRLGITTAHVAMYSGVLSRKQGLEIIIDAARVLRSRDDLTFVICGSGPAREPLKERAQGLGNVRFLDLQPRADLHQLLGLATIHLLPQIAGAADLVLPSKLTNMLASGKPVIATAEPSTGLAQEVSGSGLIVPPGDALAFAEAIASLVDDAERHRTMAARARERAIERWSKQNILAQLVARLSPILQQEASVDATAQESKRADDRPLETLKTETTPIPRVGV